MSFSSLYEGLPVALLEALAMRKPYDEFYDRLQAQAQGLPVEVYLEQLQNEVETMREAKFRDHLRAKGLWVTWPEPVQPPCEFNPIEVKGQPLSQTIIEDRR